MAPSASYPLSWVCVDSDITYNSKRPPSLKRICRRCDLANLLPLDCSLGSNFTCTHTQNERWIELRSVCIELFVFGNFLCFLGNCHNCFAAWHSKSEVL